MTKKELQPTDPEFLPAQCGLTKAAIAKMKKEYDPKLIPEAKVKGDEGYAIIHSQTMKITKVRTFIESKRKTLNADAQAFINGINSKAKELTAIVVDLEEPWRKIKTTLDEKEAREAAEKAQAEEKWMAEIEQRIQNIKDLANGLLGSNAEAIQARLMKAQGIIIDEQWYGDYIEVAEITLDTVCQTLENAHTERLEYEKNQAALETQKAEMAENQRKMDEQQEALNKQKAEQEASERAAKAAKEKIDREAREEKERQERADAAAEQAKKAEVELKARMPDDLLLRAYINELEKMADELAPTMSDEYLMEVLTCFELGFESLANKTLSQLQEQK